MEWEKAEEEEVPADFPHFHLTRSIVVPHSNGPMSLPGNVNNPNTAGCHYLIQQGAKLVTCVDDILEEIHNVIPNTGNRVRCQQKKSGIPVLASDKLLESVDYDVTHIDIITERNKQPVQDVMAALLEYELRGFVAAVPGGYIKLRGK